MGTVIGQSLGSEAGKEKAATSANREGAALTPARAAKEKGGGTRARCLLGEPLSPYPFPWDTLW